MEKIGMTVKELMEELAKIEDENMPVMIMSFNGSWGADDVENIYFSQEEGKTYSQRDFELTHSEEDDTNEDYWEVPPDAVPVLAIWVGGYEYDQ